MSKWKPWQQMAFLAYLLLLNIVIFGALAFLLVKTFRDRPQAGTEIAAAPAPNTFIALPTSTPLPPAPAAPDEANQPGSTSTAIPPLNIPPLPVPPQEKGVTTPTAPLTIVINEGSRSQAWTATPTIPLTTPRPAPATQPPAVAQRPASPTATVTPTSTPTPTRSPTPKPTATATPTRTSTPQPTATPTQTATATHTPPPTPTRTPQPADTATPTPTLRPSSTPAPTYTPPIAAKATRRSTRQPQAAAVLTASPTRLPTITPRPTSTPLPKPTPTPQPAATPKATAIARLTPTQTPTPTARPRSQPTPLIVAAALRSDVPPAGDASARLIPSGPTITGPAGSIEAVSLTNSSIALSWTPAGRTAQYRLYSDMGSGYEVYIYKAEINEPAFVDKFLRPGMFYSYRITYLKSRQEIVLAQTYTAATGGAPEQPAAQETPSASTVVPAPTALPPDAVILGLVSDNSFTDDFNTLNIVGEVRNDSNLNVGQSHIAVTFYDEAGAVIGAAEGETMFEVIPPGQISPFLITLSRPAGLASYSLRAVARPVAPRLGAQLSVVQVKRFEDEAGFFHIKGVIENTGSVVAERTKVVAMIYGRDNGIINLGFTYVDPPTLAPGKRATYEVIFTYYPRYVAQKVIPFEE